MIDTVINYVTTGLLSVSWFGWMMTGILIGHMFTDVWSAIGRLILRLVDFILMSLKVLVGCSFIAILLGGSWLWYTVTFQKTKRKWMFHPKSEKDI